MSSVASLARRKPKRFRFRPRKTKELILLILSHYPDGLTWEQIMWIMFKCDMEAYRRTGNPITGATWYKTETGVIA